MCLKFFERQCSYHVNFFFWGQETLTCSTKHEMSDCNSFLFFQQNYLCVHHCTYLHQIHHFCDYYRHTPCTWEILSDFGIGSSNLPSPFSSWFPLPILPFPIPPHFPHLSSTPPSFFEMCLYCLLLG